MRYTPHAYEEVVPELMNEWEEQFATAVGGPFRGMNLNKVDGGWLLVVKTHSQSKGPLVAFFGGRCVGDCFAQLFYDMHHDGGIKWKVDRYVKKVDA